jgi:hypothetical protein
MSVSVFSALRLNGGFPCRKADRVAAEMLQYRSTTALEKLRRGDGHTSNGGYGEGFLMRVGVERLAFARQRPALANLPRRKLRGSWNILWGKSAEGCSDGCIRGAAEGAHGA